MSFGRCEGREGIIGSEVAMVDGSAGDDEKVGGAGCGDIAAIMWEEACCSGEARWAQTEAVWRGSVSLPGQVQSSYLLTVWMRQASGVLVLDQLSWNNHSSIVCVQWLLA